MSPGPALTIVIPTLNRARLVGRAVESALAQTRQDIEIIVSDNGSTDDTPAVLARYQDPRLRHVRHDVTMPAPAHGNFLIDQARGRHFLGLSDDDHLEPDFADRVLTLLDRRPGLAFVYTGCTVHIGDVDLPTQCGPEVESGTDFLTAFYAGQRDVCWCACVTRVDDLRRMGPIPEGRVFGDMFYWTQLAFDGDVGCVAHPVSHYTFMTDDNVTGGTPAPVWGSETELLAREVQTRWQSLRPQPPGLEILRRHCRQFVARAAANQFVWTAIRGAPRGRLLRDLPPCVPLLTGDPTVWPRVVAGLVLPRRWLRRMVLGAAARRATQRLRDQAK